MITLLDVKQKPFRPVMVVLEDGGLEPVAWLISKAEEILSKVRSDPRNVRVKVKVTKLVVGDMEIRRKNWCDRNINHYRLLDDPWFILTVLSPEWPAGETVTTTIAFTSPPQRCLTVCSGIDTVGNISYGNGIVEFTNFAVESLERRDWSSSAPKWRIAMPGLCVEGKCTNEECDANGSMVIVNMGFCSFSLPEDVFKCKCPLCSKNVQPVTCAFNNCRWKWAGRKLEPLPNPPSEHRDKKWQVADDAYHLFKPKSSGGGKAQWLMLTIYTEDSKSDPILCTLCLIPSCKGIETYDCGCQLHITCVMSHPKQGENLSTFCPTCYMKDCSSQKRIGFGNFDKP